MRHLGRKTLFWAWSFVVLGLSGCSSQQDAIVPQQQSELACSNQVAEAVASRVAGDAITNLRSASTAQMRDIQCRSYARGLADGFHYTLTLMDEAQRVRCDWSSVMSQPEVLGRQILERTRPEANRICGGNLDALIARERLELRGRQILDSQPQQDREEIQREWGVAGGETGRQ